MCFQWFWQANISTADTDRWVKSVTNDHFLNIFILVCSCAESQSMPLYLDVDTSSFYTELSLAQVRLLRIKDLISKLADQAYKLMVGCLPEANFWLSFYRNLNFVGRTYMTETTDATKQIIRELKIIRFYHNGHRVVLFYRR